MISLVIENLAAPLDGTYEFDLNFTNRECHQIKEMSGVRAGELTEALLSNDRAAIVGVAVVLLGRAGKHVDPDDIWDTAAASVRLLISDDDAAPLADPSSNEPAGIETISGSSSDPGGG